ncbi:hypothetical protein M8994_23055, partial [Brucella sp. 21LCYQ03]|nr:hypothetical protein [Brucella sp. 21LCYQ03]
MSKRCLSIWFPYLLTDWLTIRHQHLRDLPLVVVTTLQGRQVIRSANPLAVQSGIQVGMVLADAKAFLPTLKVV